MFRLTAAFFLFCISISTAHAQKTIILLSGGGGPFTNHTRYYDNIDNVANLHPAPEWKRYYLVADGPGKRANLLSEQLVRNLEFKRIDPTSIGKKEPYLAATQENLTKVIQNIASRSPQDTDPVVIYVTDHGGVNSVTQERHILLWGERLLESQFREIIKMIPLQRPVRLIFDQCFGGGMIEALWDQQNLRPRSCGFAAATRHELAYNGGGFANAWVTLHGPHRPVAASLNRILQNLKFGADHSPLATLSSPVSSSDLFAKKVLEDYINTGKIKLQSVFITPNDCTRTQRSLIPFELASSGLAETASRLCEELNELSLHVRFGLKSSFKEVYSELKSMESSSEDGRATRDKRKEALKPAIKNWILSKFRVFQTEGVMERPVSLEEIMRELPHPYTDSESLALTSFSGDIWASQLSQLALGHWKEDFLMKQPHIAQLITSFELTAEQWEKYEKAIKLRKLHNLAFIKYATFRLMIQNNDFEKIKAFESILDCEAESL